MDIALKIPESQKQAVIDLFLPQYKKALEEVESIKNILNQLGYFDIGLTPSDNLSDINTVLDNGYNKQWIWARKIQFLLEGGGLTTSQLVKRILELEPEKENERSRIVASVSAVLSSKSKADTDPFKKIVNDRNENVYSLNRKSPDEPKPSRDQDNLFDATAEAKESNSVA